MSTVEVTLLGAGRCRIVHEGTGAEVESSKAPELGGLGGGFSSTDLLAAALGSCMGSSVEPVASRHGVPLDEVRVVVVKRLDSEEPRLAFQVAIHVPPGTSDDVRLRLERAAGHCLVHRSLSPDVTVDLRVAGDD